MKLNTAKELIEKLKTIENISTTKNGFPIHKFVMLPMKEIYKLGVFIDWYKIWNNEFILQNDLSELYDYEIIAIHRSGYNTFWTSNDVEHFKTLLLEEN